jgi:hypothetical protein
MIEGSFSFQLANPLSSLMRPQGEVLDFVEEQKLFYWEVSAKTTYRLTEMWHGVGEAVCSDSAPEPYLVSTGPV